MNYQLALLTPATAQIAQSVVVDYGSINYQPVPLRPATAQIAQSRFRE